MPDQYLSTDPNAGDPVAEGGYLSTDPNAGDALRPLPSHGDEPEPSLLQRMTHTAVDALPVLGGMAGGVIGGVGGAAFGAGVGGVPGAVGGAALGGAAGEAYKQLANRLLGREAPATPSAAAANIGTEGAVQGVSQAAGGVLAGGGRMMGKALMENAVRPTLTLRGQFPNVIDTIVKERLPVGRVLPLARTGSERAGAKLGEAAASVRALLDKATQSGTVFSSGRVANPVVALIDEISKQPLGEAQEKALAGMIDEFLKRHPGPLTPVAVKELKQEAQRIAKPIYRAVARGEAVSADQTLNARFNSAIASGAKESLETIPGVGAGEARTQRLIGAKRALTSAEGRRLPLMAEGAALAVGGGLGGAVGQLLGPDSGLDGALRQSAIGWLVTRGIMSPRSMSRGALVLTSAQAQELLRQFPRLAVALIEGTQAETPAAAGAPGVPQ